MGWVESRAGRSRVTWAIVALLVSACGRQESSPASRSAQARGAKGTVILEPTLVFGPSSSATARDAHAADVVVATEVELLKSASIARAAVQRLRLDEAWKISPDAAAQRLQAAETVTRRGDSLVLELTVSLDEREMAITACNSVLESYAEWHAEQLVEGIDIKEKAVVERLDALQASSAKPSESKELDALRSEREALEVERESFQRNVRLLDSCVFAGAPR